MGCGARCGGHFWAPAYEEKRAINHVQTSDPTPGRPISPLTFTPLTFTPLTFTPLTLPSPQRGEGKS